MSQPLISVIVPIYNSKPFLRECIDSILAQTHKNIEILLVNDGSTDGSGILCEKYANQDSRIHVIHQQNKGLSGARNTGLDHCSGEYISFIDSDDCIDIDFLDFLYQLLLQNNADISSCRLIPFIHGGPFTGPSAPGFCISGEKAMSLCLYQSPHLNYSVCNKLFSRQIFENIRFPEKRLFEDLATVYQLFHFSRRIVYSSAPKYYYRQRNESILNSPFTTEKCVLLDIAEEILAFVRQHHPQIEKAAISTLISASFTILIRAGKDSPVLEFYQKKARHYIQQYRFVNLLDFHSRFRNKAAIMLSFFGTNALKKIWFSGERTA